MNPSVEEEIVVVWLESGSVEVAERIQAGRHQARWQHALQSVAHRVSPAESTRLIQEAILMLGQIGGGIPDARKALRKACDDSDERVRVAAVEALMQSVQRSEANAM